MKRNEWLLIIVFFIFGVECVFFGSTPEFQTIVKGETIFRMSCDSNSMGLTLNCNDQVIAKKFNENLKLGEIYVYKGENNSNVVHRLVYCIDPNCNETVFKGDNNLYGEKVLKENITHWVKTINIQ